MASRPLGSCFFQNILINPIFSQINTLLLTYFISYYSSAFTINHFPTTTPKCTLRSALFFNYLRSDLPFSRKSDSQEGKKAWFHLRMSRILFAARLKPRQSQLDDIAHEQTIISRQLFAILVPRARRFLVTWSGNDHWSVTN